MSRFTFTDDADRDIEGLALYLRSIPKMPSVRIGRAIQSMLRSIAIHPRLGRLHAEYSETRGCEVRSRICWPYLLYYEVPDGDHPVPQVLGIIDGRRDVDTIMRERVG